MSNFITSTSYYFPEQHALLIRSDLSNYLIDYYLNLKETGVTLSETQDKQLKEMIACLSIHLMTRAPNETVAWTAHLRSETPYSLFATGSSMGSYIVGQVLTEDIRHTDVNILHSQISRPKAEPSKSIIRSEHDSLPQIFSDFYTQSEQLALKINCLEEDDTALALVAMPEIDQAWFDAHTPEQVWNSLDSYTHKELKHGEFAFNCDCSAERLVPFLRSVGEETLEELYQGDESITAKCPRCGKSFEIAKSLLRD